MTPRKTWAISDRKCVRFANGFRARPRERRAAESFNAFRGIGGRLERVRVSNKICSDRSHFFSPGANGRQQTLTDANGPRQTASLSPRRRSQLDLRAELDDAVRRDAEE